MNKNFSLKSLEFPFKLRLFHVISEEAFEKIKELFS